MKEKMVYEGFNKISIIETEIKGRKVKREKLYLPSAVAGIVIDTNNKIALVNQYRPSADFYSKEIPAGILDKDKLSNLEILIEELAEECGIDKNDILSFNSEPVEEYFINIGSSDSYINIYEIRVKAQENKKVNDNDVDSVEWVDLEKMEHYKKSKLLKDPKTLIAYYRFKDLH